MNIEIDGQFERSTTAIGQPTAAAEDEQIYCPVCNYNLTGNSSGCCSECGSLFDRELLIAAQKTNAVTLIPWDDPEPMGGLDRLRKTLRICLLRPADFARAFGVQPQHSSALSFMTGVFAICFLCLMSVFLIHIVREHIAPTWPSVFAADDWGYRLLSVVGPMCAIAGVWISTIASAVLLWILCPHYDGKRHLNAWYSICCYASAHHLLGLAGLPFVLLFDFCMGEATLAYMFAMFIGVFACGLLGTFTMDAVIKQRTSRSAIRGLLFVGLFMTYAVQPVLITFLGICLYVNLVDA